MGHEILYCVTCGARLLSSDFDRNQAFRVNEMPYCRNCFATAQKKATAAVAAATTTKPKPATTTETKPAPAPDPPTPVVHAPKSIPTPVRGTSRVKPGKPSSPPKGTARLPLNTPPKGSTHTQSLKAVPDPTPSKHKATIFGIIIGIFIVIVIIAAIASRGSTPRPRRDRPPDPETPVKKTTQPGQPPPQKMEIDPEKVKSLYDAREYRKSNPDDLIGQLERYDKAKWDVSTYPKLLNECNVELNAIKATLQKKLDVELAALEVKIEAPLKAKKFEEALKILRGALDRHKTQMWKLGVEKKIGTVLDLQHEAEDKK